MSTILKQENMWSIVETKKSITSFLVPIVGRSYTKTQLAEIKQRVKSRLTMSITNSLIGIVSQFSDSTNM